MAGRERQVVPLTLICGVYRRRLQEHANNIPTTLSYTHLSLPAPMAAVATPCCSPGRGARRRWCRSRSGPNLATFFCEVQERRKRAGLQWLLFARGVPALASPLRCCRAQRYHEKVEKRSRSRALSLSLCSATTTCWAEKSEAGSMSELGGGCAESVLSPNRHADIENQRRRLE